MFKRSKLPAPLTGMRFAGTKHVLAGTILAAASLIAAPQASAISILLGTTTDGGVGVYYNATGGEVPSNVAFLTAQFEFNLAGTGNGASFQFDDTDLLPAPGVQSFNSTFSGQPVGSSQFGLDFVVTAPTNDGSRTIPVLDAFDNTDGTVAGATNAGPVDWAINDYKGGSPSGPVTAGNAIINSVLRGGNGDGATIVLTSSTLTQVGTVFTANIAGKLISDGLTHWFTPAFGTGTLNSLGLQNTFLFSGELKYDTALPPETSTNNLDFYTGTVSLFAQTVPEPGTLALLALGLIGLPLTQGKKTLRQR